MKLIIEAAPKEIADFVLAVQSQQNQDVKAIAGKVFSKFCDTYDLHDEEIDSLIEKITESD